MTKTKKTITAKRATMKDKAVIAKAHDFGYSNLFAHKTPAELEQYLKSFSGSEAVVAFAIYGMTVNMMSTVMVAAHINDEI